MNEKKWFDTTLTGKIVTGVAIALCIATMTGMVNYTSTIPKDIKKGAEAYDEIKNGIRPCIDSLKAADIRLEHRQNLIIQSMDNIIKKTDETHSMVMYLYENEINRKK
jgi:hypothetical protein